MIIAWMFGSYLTSGYSTYLPKYIETQFGRSASVADSYAGLLVGNIFYLKDKKKLANINLITMNVSYDAVKKFMFVSKF